MKHRVGANAQAVVIAAVFLWGTAGAWGFDPLIGDYSRDDPLDVRVMSYNHNRNFIEDPGTDVEFGRILIAIDPDIICFQGVHRRHLRRRDCEPAEPTAAHLERRLGNPSRAAWRGAHGPGFAFPAGAPARGYPSGVFDPGREHRAG
jgi:hypothetical protein